MKQPSPRVRAALIDAGLLFLRLAVGGMMIFGHGWPKLAKFAEDPIQFPDPLGVGVVLSLALAVFSEFFCSVLLMIGVLTRMVAIPLLVTMLVAAFVVHATDEWRVKEFAIMYAIPYLVLMIAGPGRFSLDERFFSRQA